MNEMTVNKVKDILFTVIQELNMELPPEKRLPALFDSVLLGRKGKLDSLELVRLIVAAEQKVSEEFGVPVSLTDEKAFSQAHSPFRTVGTLSEFIIRELADAGVH
jgi:acyl carrier protein